MSTARATADWDNVTPLKIAADALELAEQFRQMALDYAKLSMECIEERKKTNEKIEKLIAVLVAKGVINNFQP